MDLGRQRRLTRSARGWALSNRGMLGVDGETFEWEGMGDTLMFEVGHEAEFVENAGNEIGFGKYYTTNSKNGKQGQHLDTDGQLSDQQNTGILQAGV